MSSRESTDKSHTHNGNRFAWFGERYITSTVSERKLAKGLIIAACAAIMAAVAADDLLPGQPETREPIPVAPFPDRISAYVWRNWFVVPTARLASVVKATPDQLTEIAREMGLPENPSVLPEWRRRGYITVIRRNWHLLPYDQLMPLLDMTREELRFSLMEDDFLYHKLGCLKPKCDPLVYAAPTPESRAARRRLAAYLKDEGVDPAAPEEPRFTFVKELAQPDPSIRIASGDDARFDLRLIFSYFADYCDPLGDPEISSYPEGLLQRLAAQGVNAVWLHTVLRTLAKDPKYPEFGDGCERRIENLKRLVARAAKYGVKVYLYMNEPRAQPPSFFEKDGRMAFRGVAQRDGTSYAMCTSCPEVRRWMRDALEQVFRQVPGLGGIFTITASENLTNCPSRGDHMKCPRCARRSRAEIVAEVNNTLIEGMRRGNPDAEAVVWDWAWPDDAEPEIIRLLDRRNCRLMCTSERHTPICRGGVKVKTGEYSISAVGPGARATNFWHQAHAVGLKTAAKVQAGATWEFSAISYLPTMDLVAQHAFNLAHEDVDGVMLSWSLGCCPSPNLTAYRDITRRTKTPGEFLDALALRLYGASAAPLARQAWTAFSDGFREYPFHNGTIYSGPHHMGPSNPLYLRPTGYNATMVGIPYDGLRQWRSVYPEQVYVDQMAKVAAGFGEGCDRFDAMVAACAPERRAYAQREAGMFRAAYLHFVSSADQARFVMARERRAKARTMYERGDAENEMREIAARELATAKAILPLVRADSRIGYECSNHYFYTPQDVREKILCCRAILAELGPRPERVALWPEGAMPDRQEGQYSTPYIEWLKPAVRSSDACAILISGGSYRNTCDGAALENVERRLLGLGVTCARLVYRTPRPKNLPIWKTAWEDAQRAVRLVRREASARGFSPEKVGAFGYSAGAHLTLLAACNSQTPAYAPVDDTDRSVPCHLNWAVPVYPAYVLEDGLTYQNERMGVMAKLSDAFLFDSRTPPMCLLHGGADPYSPLGSTAVYRKLRSMGVPAEIHLYGNGRHGFFSGQPAGHGRAEYFERVVEWLKQLSIVGTPDFDKEVAVSDRYPADATASRAKVPLWPKGKMPSVQTNQTEAPYLEWFMPKAQSTRAVQIVFPGGGYHHISLEKEGAAVARGFNAKGMAAVVVRYRTPRPVGLPKHQTAFEDAQRAIRLVRRDAPKRGLDPERIGVMGFSAGGHLSLMCATSSRLPAYLPVDDVDKTPCHVNWAVPVYPAYVLTDGPDGPNTTGGNADGVQLVDDFAFDLSTPPMCFLQGDADKYAAMGSVKAWERLRRMGIQSDLHTFVKRGHCFFFTAAPGTASYTWLDRIWEFLSANGLNG